MVEHGHREQHRRRPRGTAYSNGSATYADAAALRQAGKGAHEITADPGLNADGTLKASSPAIDSADSGADGELDTDLGNAPRVNVPSVADTGLGPRSYDDRGAEEYGSTSPGTRSPAPTMPILPHTDCGKAAVSPELPADITDEPSLSSTDLPPQGSSGHNLFQGIPAVVHAHSSGGTGGVVCYKFAVSLIGSNPVGTTVVAADAQGDADLIISGYASGVQVVNVVAIDAAGYQSPQGTYMFYAVSGGTDYTMRLTTAGVSGQPLAMDVTGQAVSNVLPIPLPPGYSYLFSFGDGSQAVAQTGTTVRHVFPRPGTYAIAARLLDETGAIVTENAQYVSISVPVATPPDGGGTTTPPGGGTTTPPGGGTTTPPGGGTTTPPPGGGTGTTPPATGVTVDRIAGNDRFETGVNVSKNQWQAGQAGAVVLARGGTFPDALSGVPLAAHRHGPLLLTDTTSLSPIVAAEIRRVLGPDTSKTVYILGGTGAITTDVEKAVRALGYQVVRYGGKDRFATALQVAQSFGATRHVVVATGQNFPDALSAGPLGAVEDAPIVLSDDHNLDPTTAAFVASHTAIETVGGQADTAVRAHVGLAGKTYLPLWGHDRYSTSKTVAQAVVAAAGHAPAGVGLASGTNFPDALTGGAFVANAGRPLLLTDPASLPGPIGDELAALAGQLRTVTIFGGRNSVSDAVAAQVAARVQRR
ncbi:cell wall-binding repeat-containing protein [Catenulispora yoronensis]